MSETKVLELQDEVELKNLEISDLNYQISVLKKKETELRNQISELKKKNEEKDKFISIIAHDLRSPFNGFLGLTQVLVEDFNELTSEEIKKIAESLNKSAISTFDLIQNLLNWSMSQNGLQVVEQVLLPLFSRVEKSLHILFEIANKKGIEICINISKGTLVKADKNMLESVLRNLLSNAIKFTPSGGRVTISANEINNNFVEISIKDSGIGIPKSLLENLFSISENTRRKGTNNEHSTGLGLILCKEFVAKNGGKIWVESEEGKGSTFFFTLLSA